MKRVKCPKCDNYITFDETQYANGQTLVFQCDTCSKQFAIRIGKNKLHNTHKQEANDENEENIGCLGHIIVVENMFHYKQIIPLNMGDNTFGRYVKGTNINCPIETSDPSIDTKHCIISVQRKKQKLVYILRDAPSNTGTFFENDILQDNDRVILSDGSIITIGATTLILRISLNSKN